MASEQLSDRIHEQHSVVVKEEPPEEKLEIPDFYYESVTKQEVILEDELIEDGKSGDESSNELPEDAPADEDRYKHFQCSECHKRYMRKRCANTCQMKHERIRLGMFACKLCQKCFASKHHLASHLEAHKRGTIRMFNCNMCSKRFSTQQLLENHEAIHSKGLDKSFECEVCSNRFSSQQSLEKHKKIHSKTFSCEICPKLYASQKNLDKHMVVVHMETRNEATTTAFDNRPYQCDECNRKYDSINSLNRCFRKHEARRLGYFKCGFCGVSLGTRHYLKQHTAKYHKHADRNEDETQDSNLELEEDPVEPEPEEDSKQFYIIEEIPESTLVKEEPPPMMAVEAEQNQLTKAEPDFEQLIPRTVVVSELPVERKIKVEKELSIPT